MHAVATSGARRFVVVGTSGAGKTTFAMALADRLAIARVELDELHWLPNWTEREDDDFRARVGAATIADAWVVDGNYSVVQDILWPRATDIVWLNFSRMTVFSRVIRRTFRRSVMREKLWAGNTESLVRALLSRDSILLWAFTTYRKNRTKFARLRADAAFAHLRWHEFNSVAQAARFLADAGRGNRSGGLLVAGGDESLPHPLLRRGP